MKLTGVVDFCEVYKNVQGIILKMLISMSGGLHQQVLYYLDTLLTVAAKTHCLYRIIGRVGTLFRKETGFLK